MRSKVIGQLPNQQTQRNWKDLEGNPTQDDNVTHWDEDGFLDIREEYDEEVHRHEKKAALVSQSEHEERKKHEVDSDTSDDRPEPVARTPADLRRMMQQVQEEAEKRKQYEEKPIGPIVSEIKEKAEPIIEKPKSILKAPTNAPMVREEQPVMRQPIQSMPFSL